MTVGSGARRSPLGDTATLTAFGKALRVVRARRDLSLRVLGERLGLSAAYLSAVETGRKALPVDLVYRVGGAVELDPVEAEALLRASDATLDRVSISHLDPDRRRLVVAFAKNFADIPPALIAQLRTALLPSLVSAG